MLITARLLETVIHVDFSTLSKPMTPDILENLNFVTWLFKKTTKFYAITFKEV